MYVASAIWFYTYLSLSPPLSISPSLLAYNIDMFCLKHDCYKKERPVIVEKVSNYESLVFPKNKLSSSIQKQISTCNLSTAVVSPINWNLRLPINSSDEERDP